MKLKNYIYNSTIKKTDDYSVVLANRKIDSSKVFIKIAMTEAGKKMIDREYNNQKFLYNLAMKNDCGFKFLPTTLNDGVIEFPDITDMVTWLGELGGNNEPIQSYLGQYMKLQKIMRDISFKDLPQAIIDDWIFRKGNVQKNIHTNSDYLLENKLISKTFVDKAIVLMSEFGDNWAFQHHDLVPWHIGRLIDGELLLIDTGWAGWSLKYYDFAYTALQVIGYTDRAEDAKILLSNAKRLYGHEKNYDSILKVALYYRGLRLAKELHEAKFDSAKRVLEFIISY
jgi:hypothetical protein